MNKINLGFPAEEAETGPEWTTMQRILASRHEIADPSIKL
jgi:hypothetical protein